MSDTSRKEKEKEWSLRKMRKYLEVLLMNGELLIKSFYFVVERRFSSIINKLNKRDEIYFNILLTLVGNGVIIF
ncbi:hypothetical protein [Neobacillus niacini]|uniref:hypothetical protein n=1 Tax=Neobacillus niacini TaxID=86668 RepID=UPI00203C8BFB|nr:hypothetical protein [Neobacillus niacini]